MMKQDIDSATAHALVPPLTLPEGHTPLGYGAIAADATVVSKGAEIMSSLDRQAYLSLGALASHHADKGDWQPHLREYVKVMAGRSKADPAHIDFEAENILKDYELGAVRGQLKGLTEDAKVMADRALDELEVPPLFQGWRQNQVGAGKDKSWTDWLADEASGPQLVNFLQWHNAEVYRYNTDPEIRAVVESRKAAVVSGAEALFDEGYLHPDMRDEVIERLKGTVVLAEDFLALAEGESRAYTIGDEKEIFIMPPLMADAAAKVLEHELAHKIVYSSEKWVDEVVADLVAGMIRSGSTDPGQAFKNVVEGVNMGNRYGGLDALMLMALTRNPIEGTKAFLRYASAPLDQREAFREAFNKSLHAEEGIDVIDVLTPVMRTTLQKGLVAALKDVGVESS